MTRRISSPDWVILESAGGLCFHFTIIYFWQSSKVLPIINHGLCQDYYVACPDTSWVFFFLFFILWVLHGIKISKILTVFSARRTFALQKLSSTWATNQFNRQRSALGGVVVASFRLSKSFWQMQLLNIIHVSRDYWRDEIHWRRSRCRINSPRLELLHPYP